MNRISRILAPALLFISTLSAQPGLEMGLPELVRSNGVFNPALRAANKETQGQIAGYFGKLPYNSAVGNYQDHYYSFQAGLSGSMRAGAFAMGGAFYGDNRELSYANNDNHRYSRTTTNLIGDLGLQANKQFSLGVSFRAYEYAASRYDDNTYVDAPVHDYYAIGIFLRGDQPSAEWNIQLIPNQPRKSTWSTLNRRYEDSWSGPIGAEFAVAKGLSFGSIPAKLGLRTVLEVPMDSVDDMRFEATPFVKMSIAKQSSLQASFSMGSVNNSAYLATALGLDLGLTKNVFLSVGFNMESSRFLLDAEAESKAGFLLGLGWNFR